MRFRDENDSRNPKFIIPNKLKAAMGSRFVDSILVFLFEFRTNYMQVSWYSLKFAQNQHQLFTNFSPTFYKTSAGPARENGETVQKV